ncbi:MAG: CoA transferase, partial [Clostridia bacterium]|nr:CoA transferase [Clostridia bacterium]
GSLIAGPFATRILADLGAEVIKVEPPGQGDPLRTWGLPSHAGPSLWHFVQSRNKKSVTIDLRRPEGQELVRRIARVVDVVVENFRPGRLEEWGLGYDDLRRVNPDIVMVRISGFGQTGPYREDAGFGNVAESIGGLRFITGYPDRPPVRVGVSLGDSVAALYAVVGALAGLIRRERLGRGGGEAAEMVDVALYEAVFSLTESILPEYAVHGAIRERYGNDLFSAAPSGVYETRDGRWLAIGANADPIFRRFAALLGRPELADDPRFRDNPARVRHHAELDRIIRDWVATQDAAPLWDALRRAGVPAGPVYSIADIVSDPQYRARGMLVNPGDPREPDLLMPGVVPRFLNAPGEVRWAGPELGEHNDEVFQGLAGLTPDEVEELRRKGVI